MHCPAVAEQWQVPLSDREQSQASRQTDRQIRFLLVGSEQRSQKALHLAAAEVEAGFQTVLRRRVEPYSGCYSRKSPHL